ncbi:hypothetical protein CTAYLR_005154 [Chrysophaeum taylorii]|uniref:Hexosyltransferase n=1 Tax=Chrysophaeum taylorii TaxID=2483200 RepID=A0AAD7UNJ2_9STRA|nr:hypothetical protein CTAYLR_005154 [Chrysophaeum taylorii]
MLVWWWLIARQGVGAHFVDVVLAGDAAVLPGLAVAASSLLDATSAPERVRLHVVTTRNDLDVVNEVLTCVVGDLDVRPFTPPHLKLGRAPARLTAELNYARLFLPDLLSVRKVVYLDADVIVEGDVTELHDTALVARRQAVAAVARPKPLRLAPSVKRNAAAKLKLAELGVNVTRGHGRLSTTLQDFNAGVLVIDLKEWRSLNLTRSVLRWMRLNDGLDIYTKGSNPPLVLALKDDFERLDQRWNCPARPKSTPLNPRCYNPAIVHLTGEAKPWDHHDPRWAAKLTPKIEDCLSRARRQSSTPPPPSGRRSFRLFLYFAFVLATVLFFAARYSLPFSPPKLLSALDSALGTGDDDDDARYCYYY